MCRLETPLSTTHGGNSRIVDPAVDVVGGAGPGRALRAPNAPRCSPSAAAGSSTYVVAAPVLTVVVKAFDDIAGPDPASPRARVAGRLRHRRSHRRADARRAPDGVPPQDRDHRREPGRGARAPGRGRPGNHHRDGHGRGRGARRRARDRRRRARRRPPGAVVEPAHRRIELGALALHADADRRRRGPRAGSSPRPRSASASTASTLTTRDSTVIAPDGRTATYGSLSAAAAQGRGAGGSGHAEGSEPVHADRPADDPPRRARHRHRRRRSTRSTSPIAGRADGRRPRADDRRLGADGRRLRGARDARRARHRAHPERVAVAADDLRSGPGGARRAADHVEPGPERRALRRADPREARGRGAAVRRRRRSAACR